MANNRFLISSFLPVALASALASCGEAGSAGSSQGEPRQDLDAILVDQCGYLPAQQKMALVMRPAASFALLDAQNTVVAQGEVGKAAYWAEAGDSVRRIDFSQVSQPGTYRLVVDDSLASAPFAIGTSVYDEALKASARALYYNRASMVIDKEHGGKWARAAGHPDTNVLVHSSAASAERPEGTVISSPGGWYDAGDYNKYIVNSAVSVYTLLLASDLYAPMADTLSLNIPESGNEVPDLTDESLYNLRWMMTMQDPTDGGVYHKLTTLSFEGFIMPEACQGQRYVVAKGTAAALDFAACMAAAARMLPNRSEVLMPLADSCRNAAIDAYAWALRNPAVEFKNPEGVTTGEYGDAELSDEWFWASAEMWALTGEQSYADRAAKFSGSFAVPSWGSVAAFGLYSLMTADMGIPGLDIVAALNTIADGLLQSEAESPAAISMTKFDWGSNSIVANEGIAKLVAARFADEAKASKLKASAANDLHYIFGRNATGYSFVTGVGTRSPMNVHHRPSAADGIAEPVPGFLAGGPNTVVPTDCADSPDATVRSQYPAKAYGDDMCSYSTNEVAINWNAPLIFLLLGVMAE